MCDGAGIIGGYGELGVLVEYISVTWWKLGWCEWTGFHAGIAQVNLGFGFAISKPKEGRSRRIGNPPAWRSCA